MSEKTQVPTSDREDRKIEESLEAPVESVQLQGRVDNCQPSAQYVVFPVRDLLPNPTTSLRVNDRFSFHNVISLANDGCNLSGCTNKSATLMLETTMINTTQAMHQTSPVQHQSIKREATYLPLLLPNVPTHYLSCQAQSISNSKSYGLFGQSESGECPAWMGVDSRLSRLVRKQELLRVLEEVEKILRDSDQDTSNEFI